jgi:hypothetical protein
MYKRVIVSLILVIKARSVEVPENCMSTEQFKTTYNKDFETVITYRASGFHSIKRNERIWKSTLNRSTVLENHKDIVTKKASKTEESPRRTRVINEILFYEKILNNAELKPYLPKYYGCVQTEVDIFLITEFISRYFGNEITKLNDRSPTKIYVRFFELSGNNQIEFLTNIALAVKEIHAQNIALTNISYFNILIKTSNGVINPVLASFGRSRLIENDGDSIDNYEDEEKRYKESFIKSQEDSSQVELRLSSKNLKKSDIFAFAYLLFQVANEYINSETSNPKQDLERYLNNTLNNNLKTESMFIICQEKNKNIFKKLLTEMTKPWDEMHLSFVDVVDGLKTIRCPDNLLKKEIEHKSAEYKTRSTYSAQNYQEKSNRKKRDQFSKLKKKENLKKKIENKTQQNPTSNNDAFMNINREFIQKEDYSDVSENGSSSISEVEEEYQKFDKDEPENSHSNILNSNEEKVYFPDLEPVRDDCLLGVNSQVAQEESRSFRADPKEEFSNNIEPDIDGCLDLEILI